MNRSPLALLLLLAAFIPIGAHAEVELDFEAFGKSLGGWDWKKGKAAQYEMAEDRFRTYRPVVSPTPEGGIFISVRIDHIRGFLASDDHASLEITIDPKGNAGSARSSISLQGRRVTSDLIVGGVQAGKTAANGTPARGVVALGSDLVANLTEKLSRESKVEPGRVTFPSVVQHNFNLLMQAVREKPKAPPTPIQVPYRAPEPVETETAETRGGNAALQINIDQTAAQPVQNITPKP